MYISINWIKDFVDLDGIDIDKLIYKFTMSTAEVEGITKYGEDTKGVIVAKILSVENVENSKKLHKLVVDTGKEKVQVVCGAPNVKVGAKVVFAGENSTVCGIKIGKATLAGVDSFGMCLSEKELGISDDHSGIILLEDDAPLGEDIRKVIPIDDTIYEVDNKSITNRPDLWGHYGVAREIATITKRKLKELDLQDLSVYSSLKALDIGVEADDENPLCLRYSAIRAENITRKVSPWKMKVRLHYCGIRSINFLADMTNYIMLEVGQPMHAFDSTKINSINVKTLKADTKFVTLDSKERTLDKGTLMICSEDKPVAIAGIMGGLDSEITDSTTSLFLESANFDAVAIRKTASKLDLRTDAAAHYEKTLDPELTYIAIARFLKLLIEEDSGAKVTSSFTDVYIKRYPEITIDIDKDYIDKSIGEIIPMEEVISTLTSLQYDLSVDGKNIKIKVPSFRATKDVSQKADIIEEIARIHGYDNITPKTNLWPLVPVIEDEGRKLEYASKELLASKYGMSEIHSYVWYDTNLNSELGIKTRDNLKIVNGIVKLDNTLRYNMAPTLICAVNKNVKYMNEVKIFEIGRIFNYNFDGKNAEESKILGMAVSESSRSEKEIVFEMKSMIDDIVYINKNIKPSYSLSKNITENFMHPINTFDVSLCGENIGYITVLNPKIEENINSKYSTVIAEINMDKLNEVKKKDISYKEVTKYQTVTFDLSLVIKEGVAYSDIEQIIKNANMKYLIQYNLIDVYEAKEENLVKKTITLRFLIGSYDKTLTKEDIDSERAIILEAFENNNIYIRE